MGCVQLPVPAALLEISSINRLVDVASRIVSKHDRSVSQRQAAAEWRAWLSANIASEAREEAHARWRQWQEALFALGLVEEHLAVALSARSKAFMVFMDTAARYGSGRLSLRVRTTFTTALMFAHAPFAQTMRHAMQCLLHCLRGCVPAARDDVHLADSVNLRASSLQP